MKPIILFFLFANLLCAYGGSWTNQAGHVQQGDLIGMDSGKVSFRMHSGHVRTIPLSAFRADEQQRIKLLCGQPDIPEGLRSIHAFAKRQIKRAQLLEKQQVITIAETARITLKAKEAFALSARKMVDNGQADPLVVAYLCANL